MYERSHEQRADPDKPRERTDAGLRRPPGGDQTGGRPTYPYQACDARWDRRPSFQEKEITGSMNETEAIWKSEGKYIKFVEYKENTND